ncbi:MAG: SDR family oxidoreductase [Pseudomonadota bacterium]
MTYLEDLFSVNGKTALVTGGATGIGRMISEALVHGGASVIIASRKVVDCEAVADQLNALDASGSARALLGDVSTEDGVLALANAVKSQTETLDILINNAGTTWGKDYERFPYHAWSRVLDVNITGLFNLTRELTPVLKAAARDEDPARIINLGSVMGTQPVAEGAYSYSASKAAVHHLTRILANELANHRITVNAFAPGPFPSNMTAFATNTPEKSARVANRVPMGRVGASTDIAGATLFLCSKAGAYVTGTVLPIDGGQSVQHGVALFT